MPSPTEVAISVSSVSEAFRRNGSGKSTLLKCVSRIYRVDDGEIAVCGRVAPFIELGVGFNPELTARDNVTRRET